MLFIEYVLAYRREAVECLLADGTCVDPLFQIRVLILVGFISPVVLRRLVLFKSFCGGEGAVAALLGACVHHTVHIGFGEFGEFF